MSWYLITNYRYSVARQPYKTFASCIALTAASSGYGMGWDRSWTLLMRWRWHWHWHAGCHFLSIFSLLVHFLSQKIFVYRPSSTCAQTDLGHGGQIGNKFRCALDQTFRNSIIHLSCVTHETTHTSSSFSSWIQIWANQSIGARSRRSMRRVNKIEQNSFHVLLPLQFREEVV
jgi:hypothetical protein